CTRLQFARDGKSSWATPVMTSGNTSPHSISDIAANLIAGPQFCRSFRAIFIMVSFLEQRYSHVYQLDSYEGNDNSADSIDHGVLQEKGHGPRRLERDPSHRQGNQEGDDDCVEDKRREDGSVQSEPENI